MLFRSPSVGIIIEDKLDESLHRIFLRELHDAGEDEENHDFLFRFLAREKKTAQSRKANSVNIQPPASPEPPGKKAKKKEDSGEENLPDPPPAKTNQTKVQSAGKKPNDCPPASDTNTDNTCLVCEGDHMTGKCDTWRDKNTSKAELVCLATQILERRLCSFCLEPWSRDHTCPTGSNKSRCPCGARISMFIC